MASLRTTVVWRFRARHARATRFLLAFGVFSLFCIIAATDARAQFDCVPLGANGTATDVTCTNSIFFPGAFVTSSLVAGNATTVNTSVGTAGFMQTFSESGIALTQNFGLAGAMLTTSTLGGTAITNNYGSTDFFTSLTTNGGDAYSFNSGLVANSSGGNLIIAGFPPFPAAIQTAAVGATGNATTVNTGTVNLAGGPFSIGLLTGSDGGNATATNYGTVYSGIYTLSGSGGGNGNATSINYGTVTTGIISYSGFNGGDGDAAVLNFGRVIGGVAAYADGSGSASITNAGLIDGRLSSGGLAVDLVQFDPFTPTTLNVLSGSRILGYIDLNGPGFPGGGTQINLFSGRDISSTLIFGGGCGCGLAGLFDTGAVVNVFGGAPYVIDIANNTVAILDPTSFAVQDKNVVDFTHTLSSMVTSRLNNPAPIGGGSSAIGFAPSGNVAVDMARDAFAGISSLNYATSDRVLFSNPNMTAADGTSVWAQGFAGQRVQDASAPTLRSVNNFYGGMMGIDKNVRPDLRVGGLLGAGNIKSNVDINSGNTNSALVFAGIYGRYAMNQAFWDFALIGGHSSNDLTRNMANNLAPNGYEIATAKYDGWFISPELAFGVRKALWPNWTLTPTARVRYLAANFGGYDESGSTTNLTVASRTSHNFEERAELTLTRTSDPVPSQRMQVSGTLGVLALQRAGDATVNTVLLGQNLAFATPGKNDVYGVYSGVGFDWRNRTGLTVFGAADYTATTDSSLTATAKGGVRVVF